MGTVSAAPVTSPRPLDEHHVLDGFDSGVTTLDLWLQRRARANQISGASRTYVVCRGARVVGFYALATGGIDLDSAPGRLRRNMPDPIPCVVLARLAVEGREQGQGLGRALLRDAVLRISEAAERIGIALILVHALDERAKAFYLAFGFVPSPLDPLVLMARVRDAQAQSAPSQAR
jgi:GNAT superfamily N-acetyltransferase